MVNCIDFTLEYIYSIWKSPGDICNFGCKPEEFEMFWGKAKEAAANNKDVIAVTHWMWFDILLIDNDLVADRKENAIIKADNIIRLNTCRFEVGDWVRTSLLVKFYDNCLFETENTIYILVGQGTRKLVNSSILSVF